MSRKVIPTLALLVLIVALWPNASSLYELTGEEELPGQVRGIAHWVYTAIRPQPNQAPGVEIAYADDVPFGMNTFLQQEVLTEVREESLRLLNDAGVKFIRQQFAWEDIEIHGKDDFVDRRNDPAGVDAWAKYDNIVDLAQQYDIEIIARLDNPPAWSRVMTDTIGTHAPPDNFDDYGDFVESVVDRYRGRITYFQLWNEPNIYPEWGEQLVDPESYTELLCTGYQRLKAANPEAVVLAGALSPTIALDGRDLNDLIFLQRMYQTGAGDCFDILSAQGYGLWSGPTDQRLRPTVINYPHAILIRDVMVEYGDAHKPIWISEAGWNTVPDWLDDPYGRVDDAQQARYAVQAYQRAQSDWPWAGVINYWFFKRASDAELNQPWYYFRLMEPDFTPTIAWDALKDYADGSEATSVEARSKISFTWQRLRPYLALASGTVLFFLAFRLSLPRSLKDEAVKQNQALALMVFVLLLATALRFHRLEVQSFWNDEGNSARLSERSLDLIIEGTASDIHPPLYYLLLRGWRELAGESEFGLRSFSVFVGIGVVALTFALGRLLLGSAERAAIISGALLAAVNPALVYYSQETRMYELLAFLAVLSTWLFVRLLQKPDWSISLAIAYIITATAGLYTHYFFPAVLLAQNLVFLVWIYLHSKQVGKGGDADTESRKRPDDGMGGRSESEEGKQPKSGIWGNVSRWALIMLAVFALYLPWLPIFFRQAGGRSGDRESIQSYLLESGKWMTYGSTVKLEEVIVPLVAYILLLLLGLYLGRSRIRKGIPIAVTLLLSLVVPLGIMWLAGSTQPAFFKFLLVAIPPLCLLAGPGFSWLYSRLGSDALIVVLKIGSIMLILLVIGGSARSLYNMYYDADYARADYRSMAARIAAENHPNAAVVLNAANQWEVFTYYHAQGAPVFPVPKGYPDPALIDDELSDIADGVDRIYALYWGESLQDPNRLVERWLDENAFEAQEEWVGDVRFVTYGVPAGPEMEMETSTKTRFGEDIELQGFALTPDGVVPGDILPLTLFWQTDQELDKRYKVFLHLVDETGRIVAQRDSEPGGGLALTSTWRPSETVLDNHGLMIPDGTPRGTYRLLLGLYEVIDPAARLPIELDGEVIDAFMVASITVDGS